MVAFSKFSIARRSAAADKLSHSITVTKSLGSVGVKLTVPGDVAMLGGWFMRH